MKQYCPYCRLFTRRDEQGLCRRCLMKGNPVMVGLIIALCILTAVMLVMRLWLKYL